jgi:hypothetical protein
MGKNLCNLSKLTCQMPRPFEIFLDKKAPAAMLLGASFLGAMK